ncbi:hypothetical protein GQ600_21043 [Phytophthora cactorum]|nr:hypothetical protein GQ600_21043 [Phytophthora cactorum]
MQCARIQPRRGIQTLFLSFSRLWLPFERLNTDEGSLAMGLFHGGIASNMSKRGCDVGEWEVKTGGYTTISRASI